MRPTHLSTACDILRNQSGKIDESVTTKKGQQTAGYKDVSHIKLSLASSVQSLQPEHPWRDGCNLGQHGMLLLISKLPLRHTASKSMTKVSSDPRAAVGVHVHIHPMCMCYTHKHSVLNGPFTWQALFVPQAKGQDAKCHASPVPIKGARSTQQVRNETMKMWPRMSSG